MCTTAKFAVDWQLWVKTRILLAASATGQRPVHPELRTYRVRRQHGSFADCLDASGYGQRPNVGVKSPMAKKRARKRQAWNKGLEVGKRDGFTPGQVKWIRDLLADRGVPGLRDLALLSTAIDTMLHGQDLLHLVVGDVQRRDGSMRPVIEVARARGMPPVRCALSKASTEALEKWITASGKKRTDYLFPGRGVGWLSSDGSAAIEPPAEALGRRGAELRSPSDLTAWSSSRRTKGSPHFVKRHWVAIK